MNLWIVLIGFYLFFYPSGFYLPYFYKGPAVIPGFMLGNMGIFNTGMMELSVREFDTLIQPFIEAYTLRAEDTANFGAGGIFPVGSPYFHTVFFVNESRRDSVRKMRLVVLAYHRAAARVKGLYMDYPGGEIAMLGGRYKRAEFRFYRASGERYMIEAKACVFKDIGMVSLIHDKEVLAGPCWSGRIFNIDIIFGKRDILGKMEFLKGRYFLQFTRLWGGGSIRNRLFFSVDSLISFSAEFFNDTFYLKSSLFYKKFFIRSEFFNDSSFSITISRFLDFYNRELFIKPFITYSPDRSFEYGVGILLFQNLYLYYQNSENPYLGVYVKLMG